MTRCYLFKIVRLLPIILLVVACSNQRQVNLSPLTSLSPIIESNLANLCATVSPQPGYSSICGILQSTYMDPPFIPKTAFYLTRASEVGLPAIITGPNIEMGDIQGVSDESGKILLNNVPPGNYYILVWAPYNWIIAVQSPEDLTPRLFALEPDRQHVLGIIYVPWP